MANKKTLDDLILEVLEEKKITFPTRPSPKDSGKQDAGVTKFLKQFNVPDNNRNRKSVANLYKIDKDPGDLSTTDITTAASKQIYLPILKKIALQAAKVGDDVLLRILKRYKDRSGTTLDDPKHFVDGIKNNKIYSMPDLILPDWLKISSDPKLSSNVALAAKTKRPNDIFDDDDIIEILKDPKNKLHYWMVEFVERSIISAQQGKFDTKVNKHILKYLVKLRDYVPTVDPEDKALGVEKPIPSIPISGRYATRVGGETPATLKRVFENAISGISKNNYREKLKAVNKFASHIKNKKTSGDIEMVFSQVLVVDYLRRIVQDYEASAGGFLFENFLALIMGGTKEGGNLKIEDFTIATATGNQLGSAKLYKSTADKYSGSAKLFFNLGTRDGIDEIVYILAKKGQNLEKIDVYQQKLYVVYDKKKKSVIIKDAKGSILKNIPPITAASKGQIEFDWPKTIVATINLGGMKIDQDDYNSLISHAMNDTQAKVGDFFKSINNLNTLTTKFFSIMKSDKPLAQEKLNTFNLVVKQIPILREKAFTTLTQSITSKGKQKVTDKTKVKKATKDKISEIENKSLKKLDKLIEHVILEYINK